jgi:hypothetical protein
MLQNRNFFTNLTDEKYYDRVFANGIEPAPNRSGYAGLSLAFWPASALVRIMDREWRLAPIQ